MGPAAKGRSRASKKGKVRIFTNARVFLADKNPATFVVDTNAYDTSDLVWDGSFDNDQGTPPLSQYCAESGYVIGDGKLLGECKVEYSVNKWILTIMAVSDIDPLVWMGETSVGGNIADTYHRTGGTDQTTTLQLASWV